MENKNPLNYNNKIIVSMGNNNHCAYVRCTSGIQNEVNRVHRMNKIFKKEHLKRSSAVQNVRQSAKDDSRPVSLRLKG